ncbi:MAG: putative NRPS [Alphaproteobacteria bacterium]|nr:MAG: putative NRPS [Alphaproteobacteria bacterium]
MRAYAEYSRMSCVLSNFSSDDMCVVAALAAGGAETAFEFVRWRGDQQLSLTWSRADLRAAVQAEASQLIARTRRGDRVIVAHPPGPAFVASFLACLGSGRIAVPAAAPLTAASKTAVARLADASGATLVLSGGEHLPRATDADAYCDLAPAFDDPSPDDIAYLQFTSGSTQAPRGAVITHRALRANLAAIHDAWGLSPKDRGVFWLPPFHDMGLVGAILAPLAFGVPSTLMHPAAFLQRPARWLQLMSERRATFSGGPNFAYDLVAERVAPRDVAGLDLSAWRVAVNGAEPVRRRTMRRFADAFAPAGFREHAFAPGYGLAESVLFVTARCATESVSPCDGDDETPVDCGPPGCGVTVRVVDEGFLRDGRLHVCGRAKDVLIRGGRKIHAADVEAVVAAALGRRVPAAAFALTASAHEEIIAVLIEHAPDDADAAFALLIDAIAAAVDLTPDVIAFCGPGGVRLTTSGKIARAATRDAWRAGTLPVRNLWRRPVPILNPAVAA